MDESLEGFKAVFGIKIITEVKLRFRNTLTAFGGKGVLKVLLGAYHENTLFFYLEMTVRGHGGVPPRQEM